MSFPPGGCGGIEKMSFRTNVRSFNGLIFLILPDSRFRGNDKLRYNSVFYEGIKGSSLRGNSKLSLMESEKRYVFLH